MSNSPTPEPYLSSASLEAAESPSAFRADENVDSSQAIVVEASPLAQSFPEFTYFEPPPIPNVAAIGGAVASCLLGTLALVGVLLTPFSIVNGVLAIPLGLWGLNSPKRRLALIGIGLGTAGIVVNIGRILSSLAVSASGSTG
jgi:hypothetical protein